MKYISLFFKGMAMGAADLVPGVSGGTIAFITGIYEELLRTISSLNFKTLKILFTEGISEFWKAINGNFLVVLLAGIATSLVSLSKLIHYLLNHYPIWIWSFFFGLIVASIIYIGRQIAKWNFSAFLGIMLGGLIVVFVSIMPPLSSTDNYFSLFIAGFLASTAMILPGISGSFILLILGSYSLIINAISQLTTQPVEAMKVLTPVGLGVVLGLVFSSKALYYLMQKYENFMMSLLTGFLVGSLFKVWPWKSTETIFNKTSNSQEEFFNYTQGKYQSITAFIQNTGSENAEQIKVLKEYNVSPNCYADININTSSELGMAILFAIIGFSLIFIIEFLAKKRNV